MFSPNRITDDGLKIALNKQERHQRREQDLGKVILAMNDYFGTQRQKELVELLNKIRKKDDDDLGWIQKKIENYEHGCLGLTTVSSAKSFACVMKVGAIGGVVVTVLQLYYDGFGDRDDPTENSLTSIFTVATIGVTALLACGTMIECLASRAIDKANKYRRLTWPENRELKILIKFFQKMIEMHEADDNRKADELFSHLMDEAREIPWVIHDKTLFKKYDQIINLLLLSLPESHAISSDLDQLAQFSPESLATSPLTPSEDMNEVAEQATSTEIEMTESDFSEPEIMTIASGENLDSKEQLIDDIAKSVEGSIDYDVLRTHCLRKIASGHSFEQGIFSRVKPKEAQEGNLPDPVEKFIRRKTKQCALWSRLEDYTGVPFEKLKLPNGSKIKRDQVFDLMSYHEYRRRASSGGTTLCQFYPALCDDGDEFEEESLFQRVKKSFRKMIGWDNVPDEPEGDERV